MISFATRGLLLSTALVLATAFAARPATAGIGFWAGPNCADPAAIAANFTGSFASYAKCEPMCRAAASVCRASVKSAIGCMRGESLGYWTTWAAGMCAPLTGVEKNACLISVKQNRADDKLLFKNLRDSSIATCDGFLQSCLTGCMPPL